MEPTHKEPAHTVKDYTELTVDELDAVPRVQHGQRYEMLMMLPTDKINDACGYPYMRVWGIQNKKVTGLLTDSSEDIMFGAMPPFMHIEIALGSGATVFHYAGGRENFVCGSPGSTLMVDHPSASEHDYSLLMM